MPGKQLGQVALKDRHPALAKSLHLSCVVIDAQNQVPISAKRAAATSPTHPDPITQIETGSLIRSLPFASAAPSFNKPAEVE
jgi:hypothetical protein